MTKYIYPALNNPPPSVTFSDQFAFRPTGSTTSAIITILQTITNLLDTEPYVRVIALDFSKAFDSIRHSSVLDQMSTMPIPDNIYNWVSNFLMERYHLTHFKGQTSCPKGTTASVVQGSALGPCAYMIAASALRPVTPGNDMDKFADDTYLIVPVSNDYSVETELNHIEQWAESNNLKLNKSKTVEIIFRKPRSNPTLPPTLPSITRVDTIKILGVTLSSKFSVSSHVDSTLVSCSQSLHALRTLRTHGLPDPMIQTVFSSKVLSKITYCSPAWSGFANNNELDRLDAFLRRSKKFGFCCSDVLSVREIYEKADDKLFKNVLSNHHHVLKPLLPPPITHNYNLRSRSHSLTLPVKTALSALNYITRIVFKNSY